MFKNFEPTKYKNIDNLILVSILENYINKLVLKLENSEIIKDNNNIDKLKREIDNLKFKFVINNIKPK